jgi:hypothetical protein
MPFLPLFSVITLSATKSASNTASLSADNNHIPLIN